MLKICDKKMYVINDQNNTDYEGRKRWRKWKWYNRCDYSDAYIIVTGDITETCGDANTRVVFENCAPFTKCITHINDKHVDGVDNLDIITLMYNLVEYRNNYGKSLGRLW